MQYCGANSFKKCQTIKCSMKEERSSPGNLEHQNKRGPRGGQINKRRGVKDGRQSGGGQKSKR